MSTKIIKPAVISIGDFATFGIETDLVAPYKYHWKKDGAIIAGAPNAKSYQTPPLSAADLRAKYSVTVFGQDKAEESNAVVINEDTPDPLTISNQGLPKPAWQPFVEPVEKKGKS